MASLARTLIVAAFIRSGQNGALNGESVGCRRNSTVMSKAQPEIRRGRESMSVRVQFGWLIAFSVLAGSVTRAQDQYFPGGAASMGPPPAYSAPAGANFASPQVSPYYYGTPGSPDLYEELLPNRRKMSYEDNPRTTLPFREMLRGSWFRMEYLQGSIHHADPRTLGTPFEGVDINGDPVYVEDPSEQFLVYLTNGITQAYAQTPTTEGIDWSDAQGGRISFGIPITKRAWLEASFWGYMNQRDSLNLPTVPNLPGFSTNGGTTIGGIPVDEEGNTIFGWGIHGTTPTTFLITNMLVDGQEGLKWLYFDHDVYSRYESKFKGGNIDLVLNWVTPDIGFRAQPIIGYRHEQFTEALLYGGGANGLGSLPVNQEAWLKSQASNQRDQVEFGIRNEIATRFFTIGAQEKFGLGANNVRTNVVTYNANQTLPDGVLDGTVYQRSSDSEVIFAPSFDLDVYAKVPLTPWMNFRIGYNLLLMGNIAAADRSIRFDSISDGTGGSSANITSNARTSYRTVSALTIGGEIVLP